MNKASDTTLLNFQSRVGATVKPFPHKDGWWLASHKHLVVEGVNNRAVLQELRERYNLEIKENTNV